MNRPTKRIIGLLTITLLALALSGAEWTAVRAAPTAVTLIFFEADGVVDGVRLTWETGTEFNTAGFLVKRAAAADPNTPPPDGQFTTLTGLGDLGNGFIPATGAGGGGASYEELDDTAVSGQAYWYRLFEVENSNQENALETEYVIAGTEPTSTPQAIVTNTPRPNATATNTPRPTNTPSPSVTATAASNAGPTNTPPPSPTPTATAATANTAAPPPTTAPTQTRLPAGPTATLFQFPTAAAETAGDGAAAIAQAAGQDGYPGPETPTAPGDGPVDNGLGYPANQPASDVINGNETAVTPRSPAGIGDGANGDDGGLPAPADAPAQSSGQAGDNNLLLWVGFAGALLVFAGGVFGSIVMYTRRQDNQP